jgi:hypothetical protein
MGSLMNIRARIDRVSQDAREAALKPKERPRSNSRRGDRHRLVGEKARATHKGVEHEVELINVSGGGAMIGAGFEPSVSDLLHLHLGENGSIECAVCWIRGGRIGLEFAHETQLDCSAEEQAVLLREVIQRTYGAAHFGQSSANAASHASKEDDETRRAKRHPLIWRGTLHCDGQRTPIRVRNISATGAMVQCSAQAAVGSDAMLELGDGLTVSATVGWAVGDQVGLNFHNHFDVTQLARSTPEVAPATWVQPDYLTKAGASESPWDPKWQRLNMREINQELEGFLKR